MKHNQIKWRFSAFTTAFLILAFLFLALGLGTLGSAQSTGRSYRLAKQRGESLAPAILIHLTDDSSNLYVSECYVNVGTVYSEYGNGAKLRLAKGNNPDASFYYTFDLDLINLYKGEKSEVVEGDMLYNWVKFDLDGNVWALSNNAYWRLTAIDADILINEIVFVGNNSDGTGKRVLLKAEIDEKSNLPEKDAIERASAVIDSQRIPTLSESSFFRFGQEEIPMLSTLSEMRQGGVYELSDNVYHMDRTAGSLGVCLLSLGSLVFGFSPFGIRLVPFLASFGILIFGYLLIKKMTKSEKAGFAFALIYALSGVSLSLGHFASPVTIAAFFLLASFYFIYGFFRDGIQRAKFSSALPVLFGALFAAAAVCTNGVCLIPALGIAALFVAGAIRQRRKDRALLDALIEEAEAAEETEAQAGKEKVVKALNENRFREVVAPTLFGVFLVFGGFLLALLSCLPLFNVYTKVLDPSHSKSIFYFFGKAFAGGFAGNNGFADPQSNFSLAYILFRGTGERYGVTLAGILPAAAAILLGLISIVLLLVRFAKDGSKQRLVSIVLLLTGFVVSLVSALASAGLPLLLLSEVFLCMFAGCAFSEIEGGKGERKVATVSILLLAIFFALFFVFTFSIPLPASFAGKFFA